MLVNLIIMMKCGMLFIIRRATTYFVGKSYIYIEEGGMKSSISSIVTKRISRRKVGGLAQGVSSVQDGGIIETFPILRRFVSGNLFLVRGPQSNHNQYLLFSGVCLFHIFLWCFLLQQVSYHKHETCQYKRKSILLCWKKEREREHSVNQNTRNKREDDGCCCYN